MLLLLDNVDSFTYNLAQAFQILKVPVTVLQSDRVSVKECLSLRPDWIVIGPGPGAPSQAGISNELIKAAQGKIPLLGVCLGHQCIAEVYGGDVVRARRPMHGKTSNIEHDGKGIFRGLGAGFTATRYHSLVVEPSSLPKCLHVSARSEDGEIMGLRHCEHELESVQFHPESVLTEQGLLLFKNFLKI
ncbi:MAG: aminodeoxychorismate/anthranilate synthase component II [Parachlamydiaceae bacterium]|nr:aminodeoxychorismate/anthranilate synthase component II [Parachlamydiaceae bacterium]